MSQTIQAQDLTGRQRYRLLTSLVVPRPIGWISTRNEAGTPNLAPYSYFNALSAAPMLVGASIGRRRDGPKHTLTNIRQTGEFAVNLVTERHLNAMVQTSGDWPPDRNEFDIADLESAPCDVVDVPCVADAAAVFECTLYRRVDLGSANTLVIGEVMAVRLGPELDVDPETFHVGVESLRPVGRLGLDEYTFLGAVHHVPRPRV